MCKAMEFWYLIAGVKHENPYYIYVQNSEMGITFMRNIAKSV